MLLNLRICCTDSPDGIKPVAKPFLLASDRLSYSCEGRALVEGKKNRELISNLVTAEPWSSTGKVKPWRRAVFAPPDDHVAVSVLIEHTSTVTHRQVGVQPRMCTAAPHHPPVYFGSPGL